VVAPNSYYWTSTESAYNGMINVAVAFETEWSQSNSGSTPESTFRVRLISTSQKNND